MRSIALVFLLAACAAEGPPPPSALTPQGVTARLPAEAGGLRRGADTPLEGGGREVSYATAGRTAAGFVQLVPAPGEAHERWLAQAAEGGGPHRRLREVAAFSEGLLRCAELEGSYGRQAVRSLVCTGHPGATAVHLRVSMPRREPPAADARAFARAVAEALR